MAFIKIFHRQNINGRKILQISDFQLLCVKHFDEWPKVYLHMYKFILLNWCNNGLLYTRVIPLRPKSHYSGFQCMPLYKSL